MSISVRNVSKSFGSFKVLDDVSLEVTHGSLLALLGPSGSGKTTLLRVIAGLEMADSGKVVYQKEDITNYSAKDRNVGFVFQHYALFRHMTVEENIGFGLRVRKVPKPETRERVHELLKLIRLEGLAGRYPAQLSGGQRQRVALARALAAQPRVLLLDEPFGALDSKVRQELRQWLRRLHDEIHVTSIFVTHDQEEAFEVADQVVVMNKSKLEQVGSPQEVYESPSTPFVYDFLGAANHFRGNVRAGHFYLGKTLIPISSPFKNEASAIAYVRPHEIRLHQGTTGFGFLAAIVDHINLAGPTVQIDLTLVGDGIGFKAELTREQMRLLSLSTGTRVFAELTNIRVFPD